MKFKKKLICSLKQYMAISKSNICKSEALSEMFVDLFKFDALNLNKIGGLLSLPRFGGNLLKKLFSVYCALCLPMTPRNAIQLVIRKYINRTQHLLRRSLVVRTTRNLLAKKFEASRNEIPVGIWLIQHR